MVREIYSFRIEKDFIGEVRLKSNCLWGIATERALNNFKISSYKQHFEFISAMAMVKYACAETNYSLGFLDEKYYEKIKEVCLEIIEAKHTECFPVDPFQGGAGTSVNMNFNEVIANLANIKLGGKVGDYFPIDPLKHINMHQSTNDVYPTALKVATLFLLKKLEEKIMDLQESLQKKEQEFSNIVKSGRTQLQDAVPITLGMEFGAYAEAIARDRWRIFKCRERIKTVNLGGTAVGTGLGASKKYIFQVVRNLKIITGLNISRAENLVDATQNLDSFSEISGMIRTYANNLYKISNDLRLMGSGPKNGFGELKLPMNQGGSSIMPSKINPVICESVSQVALKVMNNDYLISQITSLGQLELNHLLPLLNFTILESLELLINSTETFEKKCIIQIKANKENCRKEFYDNPISATILLPYLGYKTVEKIITYFNENDVSLFDAINKFSNISAEKLGKIFSPQKMYKLGYDEKDKLE